MTIFDNQLVAYAALAVVAMALLGAAVGLALMDQANGAVSNASVKCEEVFGHKQSSPIPRQQWPVARHSAEGSKSENQENQNSYLNDCLFFHVSDCGGAAG
jgi:hypothetical protein